MATVQVLPPSGTSSRKKEHLEAGKRRLEEFRKKKAADRAKKATPNIQPHPTEAVLHEKQTSEAENVRLTDSDGAGTSDGAEVAFSDSSSGVINNEIKANEYLHKADSGSSYETYGGRPFFGENNYASLVDKVQTQANDLGFQAYDNVNSQEIGNNEKFGINFGTVGGLAVKTATEQASAFQHSFNQINTSSSQYSYYGSPESLSNNTDSPSKDFSAVKSGASQHIASNGDSVHRNYKTTDSYSGVEKNMEGGVLHYNNPLVPENGERIVSSFVGHLTSGSSQSPWSTESRTLGLDFDTRSSSRRTRPSFLDSIHTSTVSSASVPLTEAETADSFSSKPQPTDILYSSASQNGTNSQVAAGNGDELFRHGINEHNMERNHNFQSPQKDDDFAALEQHIEDLTQEKFSLQRALEASRALAESLAAENSALTDSYNQQGSAVQQLKLDMEKLQEEIKAQLVELESMKIGYTNAQMECNAADERAKLLASEVIGLEEKALRLRSSELKLERQLENLQAEVSSSKKKTSSLEKERKDLQLTIDAMQEEKKMLQSMLRKASASGNSVDISKSSNNKKDASTSTQDLDSDDRNSTSDSSNLEMHSTSLRNGSDSSNYLLQPENTEFSLEAPLNIPPDQLRMIQNINTLISELSLEKEELTQALSTESSQSSKLKELNEELSRKLEVQTQRLELLTSQNMVNDNIPPPRQPDSHPVHDNIAYADEGDEVVERVLGWIMKLFPGGPSKRRTSKLI